MREALQVSVEPWHALTLECVIWCICHRVDSLKCLFTRHIYYMLSRQISAFLMGKCVKYGLIHVQNIQQMNYHQQNEKK